MKILTLIDSLAKEENSNGKVITNEVDFLTESFDPILFPSAKTVIA